MVATEAQNKNRVGKKMFSLELTLFDMFEGC